MPGIATILEPLTSADSAEALMIDRLVNEATRMVARQKQLENQVRQLQKVEALGQFIGGIAHDFNNLLAVILASDTLLLDALPQGDGRRVEAEAIEQAALCAAALTRQLLSFMRPRAFESHVLDVNTIVSGAEPMLRRVIGEDIGFSIHLGSGLGNVRADAGLIGQVLMNLVVNARDAMPDGGKLSVQTSHVTLGCTLGSDDAASPTVYVRLAVSDTGCGMDADTRRRVFEPFFTTKILGRGTGLGLSTCQDIVKQAGGRIHVDSEPGRGSVFEVLLPVTSAVMNRATLPAFAHAGDALGTETILVVEDDIGVRSMVHRMLGRLGYRVFSAGDGQEAVSILHSCGEPIHLVLCDVVMPDLSGEEVVSRVQARSRGTRALFMSGYTTHSRVRNGAIQEGPAFIQKPFLPSELAMKVREVLDA